MPKAGLFIKSSGDFRAIMREGRKAVCPHFILYSKPSQNIDYSGRLGISVSKASVKLAVDRNRVKRIIRAVWQSAKRGNKDAVLVVKKGILSLKHEQIHRELHGIFDKYLS